MSPCIWENWGKEGIQEDLEVGKGSGEFNYIIASKIKRIKGKLIRKFILDLKIFVVYPKVFLHWQIMFQNILTENRIFFLKFRSRH